MTNIKRILEIRENLEPLFPMQHALFWMEENVGRAVGAFLYIYNIRWRWP